MGTDPQLNKWQPVVSLGSLAQKKPFATTQRWLDSKTLNSNCDEPHCTLCGGKL